MERLGGRYSVIVFHESGVATPSFVKKRSLNPLLLYVPLNNMGMTFKVQHILSHISTSCNIGNEVPWHDPKIITLKPFQSVDTDYNASGTQIGLQHPEAWSRNRRADRDQRAECVVRKASCDHTEDQGSKVFKCHLLTEERRQETLSECACWLQRKAAPLKLVWSAFKEVGALLAFSSPCQMGNWCLIIAVNYWFVGILQNLSLCRLAILYAQRFWKRKHSSHFYLLTTLP